MKMIELAGRANDMSMFDPEDETGVEYTVEQGIRLFSARHVCEHGERKGCVDTVWKRLQEHPEAPTLRAWAKSAKDKRTRDYRLIPDATTLLLIDMLLAATGKVAMSPDRREAVLKLRQRIVDTRTWREETPEPCLVVEPTHVEARTTEPLPQVDEDPILALVAGQQQTLALVARQREEHLQLHARVDVMNAKLEGVTQAGCDTRELAERTQKEVEELKKQGAKQTTQRTAPQEARPRLNYYLVEEIVRFKWWLRAMAFYPHVLSSKMKDWLQKHHAGMADEVITRKWCEFELGNGQPTKNWVLAFREDYVDKYLVSDEFKAYRDDPERKRYGGKPKAPVRLPEPASA